MHTGPQRRATIRDVAALSGASLKTVSRVVNGEPGVSPDLALRVREAIERLGYQHNLSASNLRRSNQRTSLIGVLLQDVSNPFEGAMHRSIELVARTRGASVLAGSVEGDPDRERQLARELTQRRVDGAVVMPAGGDHSFLLDERKVGTQFVFVDRPASFFDADSVLTDNRGGARMAVKHLVSMGHQRIAFLGDSPSISTAVERHRGYIDEMHSARLPVPEDFVIVDVGTDAEGFAATEHLLDLPTPPTAIFSARNLITYGVLHALRARNARHNIALVGFDDFPLADLLEPGLTVVAQDPGAIGRVAAERLFARIDGDTSPYRHVVCPVTLVQRGSGELRVSG